MNSLRLKQAIAGVSSSIILLGSMLVAPIANAQTFNDVTPSMWSYTYVEDAVAKGFFDTGSLFYPTRGANRAELAKLVFKVAKYAGIITDIDTTNAPSFTDVPQSAWFYPYVATVTKANLLGGYKDANGNPTGKFGPSDMVTRAQAAKSFINAAGVANKATPAASFSDVHSGDWFMDYVSTAYNWMIMDGYSNGMFGPNDSVTREQLAKIISNSLNPVDRWNMNGNMNNANMNGTMNGNSNTNSSIVKAGTLDVSLSANTPAAAVVPKNATAAKYLVFKVTAGSGNDIQLMGVTISRSGLGSKDDFDRIWLEKDNVRISSRTTIGTDDKAVLTVNPAVVVPAGTTVELTVVAQMSAASGGLYNALGIMSSGDVMSSAMTVTGTFPVNGNTMQTAAYDVTNVTFTKQGTSTTYKAGDLNQTFGQFQIQNNSSSKDISVKSVNLKNDGSGDPSKDLANLALYQGGKKVSTQVTFNGDYVTFDLGAGDTIPYGNTRTYYVRADVIDVQNTPSDTIIFRLRYVEDFNAIEVTTGYGVTVNNGTIDPAVTTLATYTIQGGKITIVRDPSSPTTQSRAKSTNDITFLVSKFDVQQPFTADGINVYLCANTSTVATIAADIDNVRVTMGDSIIQSKSLETTDLTVVGPAGCPTLGGTPSVWKLNFDSTVNFPAGNTLVKVLANFSGTATLTDKYAFFIDNNAFFSPSQSAEYNNGNTVQSSDVIGSAPGNPVTVQGSVLNFSRTDGYTAGKALVPGSSQSMGKWNVTNNDAADLTILQLKFVKTSAAIGNPVVSGTILADNYVTGCMLFNGTTQVGTQNISGTFVDFTGLNVPVAKNGNVVLEMKCNISNGAVATNRLGFQPMYVDAQDTFGNVAGTIPDTGNPTSPLSGNGVGVSSTYFAVVDTGTLTIIEDSDRPVKAYLPAGTTDVPVAKFKLSATNDDIKVTTLYFFNVGFTSNTVTTAADGRVLQYELTWPGSSTVITGSSADGVVKFNLGDSSTLIVPKDGNVVVTVRADLNPITLVAESYAPIRLATKTQVTTSIPSWYPDVAGVISAGGVRAISNSLGSELTTATVSGQSNQFVVTRSKATFARQNLSSSTIADASESDLYKFTVTADAAGDVDVAQLTFDFTGSNIDAITNIKVVDTSNLSQPLNTVVGNVGTVNGSSADFAANNPVTLIFNKDNNASYSKVSAGTSRTYILRGTVTRLSGFVTTTLNSRIVAETAAAHANGTFAAVAGGVPLIIWSDAADPAHSATTSDFLNGLYFNELPLDNSTVTIPS